MKQIPEETHRKEFAGTLRKLRKEARMSQEELAEHLDVSRVTIVNTEKGQSIPKAEFIEKAFRLFRSEELVTKYTLIQRDKKELASLATRIHPYDRSAAIRILRKVVREAIKSDDHETSVINIFQSIMWDLMQKGKVNAKKIDFVIKLFDALEAERFADLLIALYNISYQNGKNFDAYIKISEGIIDKLKLDTKRISLLMGKTASAYYYKGNPHKAYLVSCKAIELIAGENFQHRGDTYHRHGLICLQLEYFDEAIESFNKCLAITNEPRLKRLATLNLARCYYMQGEYTEAQRYWDHLFATLDKNNLNQINSLNDIIMMHIRLGNIHEARKKIKECERLLKIAEESDWAMYHVESILLKRNMVLLDAVITGNFISKDLSDVLHELKSTHLRDEYELTKNFILDRLFSSSKMDLS